MSTKDSPFLQSINVSIRLLDIRCLDFSFTEYAKKNTNPILFENYEFEFRLEASLNQEEKTFVLIFTTKLFEKRSEVKYELAELKSLTRILFANFNEIVVKNDNQIGIPDPVFQSCAGIAVSGIRGMYCIKLENSLYANAVVPLIDPKVFTPKPTIPIA